MKRLILLACSLFTLTTTALADTWIDPETGISWTYAVLSAGSESEIGTCQLGEYSYQDSTERWTTAITANKVVGNVTIPEYVNGLKVVHLANYAFRGNFSQVKLTIPAGISFTSLTFCMTELNSLIFRGTPPDLTWPLQKAKIKSIYFYDSVPTRSSFFTLMTSLSTIYCFPRYLETLKTYALSGVTLSILGGTVQVMTTLADACTLPFSVKDVAWGESVELVVTPNKGYTFLGWSSNVEDVVIQDESISFVMPELNMDVVLIAAFIAEETRSTWAENVIAGKVKNGELITSNSLQVMAMKTPVIAVEDGKATVGVSLQKAESLNGEWEEAAAEAVDVDENGAISISVAADEKAVFYKFVVPSEGDKTNE